MKPVIRYFLNDETWKAIYGDDPWVGCYSHLFEQEHFKKIDDRLTEIVAMLGFNEAELSIENGTLHITGYIPTEGNK